MSIEEKLAVLRGRLSVAASDVRRAVLRQRVVWYEEILEKIDIAIDTRDEGG